MAAISSDDSTLSYFSQEPIFKVEEEEDDDDGGCDDDDDDRLSFLHTLALGACRLNPFDGSNSDFDSNHDLDSDSDAEPDAFYNVFYRDSLEDRPRDSAFSSEAPESSNAVNFCDSEGELGSGSPTDGLRVAGIWSEWESGEENENRGFGYDLDSGSDMDPFDVLDCGLRWDADPPRPWENPRVFGEDFDCDMDPFDVLDCGLCWNADPPPPWENPRVFGEDFDCDMDRFDVLDCELRWDADPPLPWENPRVFGEDFDWEEVEPGRDDEGETLSTITDEDGRFSELASEDNFNSHDAFSNALVQNLEWAILLSVNNLERVFEIHYGSESNEYISMLNDQMIVDNYDAIFRFLADDENALKGNPPAAKLAVDNLQVAVLSGEDLGKSECVLCAVCKDEISLEEPVKKLPCCHYYHGECILPWLNIRNTCPVCRYELPTDDAEYEWKKRGTSL